MSRSSNMFGSASLPWIESLLCRLYLYAPDRRADRMDMTYNYSVTVRQTRQLLDKVSAFQYLEPSS